MFEFERNNKCNMPIAGDALALYTLYEIFCGIYNYFCVSLMCNMVDYENCMLLFGIACGWCCIRGMWMQYIPYVRWKMFIKIFGYCVEEIYNSPHSDTYI